MKDVEIMRTSCIDSEKIKVESLKDQVDMMQKDADVNFFPRG